MQPKTICECCFLHILPANSGRTYRFIRFIHENFDVTQHKFIIDADYNSVIKKYTRLLEFSDLFYWCDNYKTKSGKAFLLKLFKESRNIIWHSLSFVQIDAVEYLLKHKFLIKKSSWIENGYDIFFNNNNKARKGTRLLVSEMKTIGSISPLNAGQITEEYGRNCYSVCYPPEPGFFELPYFHLKHREHSDDYRVLQLGSDIRVFSNINGIISFISNINKDKSLSSILLVIPQNITLKNDRLTMSVSPKTIRVLEKMFIQYSVKTTTFKNIHEYINYYSRIDDVILSPSKIVSPEYILAPVLCGCNVYVLKNKNLTNASAFLNYIDDTGKINIDKLRKLIKKDEIPDIFSVFFPNKIKAKWEGFFDLLLKENSNE